MSDPSGWNAAFFLKVVGFGLLSRILVLLAGVASTVDDPTSPVHRAHAGRSLDRLGRDPAVAWYRFDALWYCSIAEEGYRYDPERQSSSGFMPLLPLAMAGAGRAGLDIYDAGLCIANLAFALGLGLFGLVAERASGSRETAWKACLLVACCPFGYFFSAPYQESLYFAAVSAALLAWQARRPAVSGAALAVASLARLTAASMAAGLVLEWAWNRMRGRDRTAGRGAWLVASSAFVGPLAMMLYFHRAFGRPLAHFQSHTQWGRKPPSLSSLLRVGAEQWGWIVGPKLLFLLAAGLAAWAWREWLVDPLAPRLLPIPSTSRPAASRADLVKTTAGVIISGLILGFCSAGPGRAIPEYLGELSIANSLSLVAVVALGIRAWARRGPLWGCLILIPMAQAASTGTMLSTARVALASFPLAIDAAELLRGRLAFTILVILMAASQLALASCFVRSVWTG